MNAIFAFIEDSEYEIRKRGEGIYTAANRAENLRFNLTGNRFGIEPRDFGEGRAKPWEATIEFEGASKGERSVSALNPSWKVDRKRGEASAPGITIEYWNGKEGLRQNFWVLAPPDGNEPLTLNLKVQSRELRFEVVNDEVLFFDRNNTEVMAYSDLNVWDANEQRLGAAMVPLGAGRFAIVVDDSTAVYPILVDPVANVKGWTDTESGSQFGYAVAGWSHYDAMRVLVGAPYYDTGLPGAGKVFAYVGNILPSSPTWTKEGDQGYSRFGASVAWDDRNFTDDLSLGDIAIGTPGYDMGTYGDCGKVVVYSGLGTSPVWSTSPPWPSAYFGHSVCWVKDMDEGNPSLVELVVGAPGYDNSKGAVYLFKGGSSPDTVADWTVYGSINIGQLGYCVAEATGAKGNGESAVVIGAPFGNTHQGNVYVYYKSGTTLGGTPTTITGENTAIKFGFSVAGGYDQNGPENGTSYTDIVVGAPDYSNGQSQAGKAYVFRGSSSGISTTAAWTREDNQAGVQTGWSVAMGNFNYEADSKADLLIGSPSMDSATGKVDAGVASSYITDSTGTPVLDAKITGLENYDHNGKSVAFMKRSSVSTYPAAWISGAPDAHHSQTGALLGGTVLVVKYQP
jgi:hypothetical protein